MFEITAREELSEWTYLLEIRHPFLARAARPGQFVIVMPHALGERIPLTLADFDREAGTITLVVQAVGKTTREMQERCRVGSALHAVVGPLGLPSDIAGVRRVACVGGGLGVAPIFPHLRAFHEAGAFVAGVVGFRTASLAFWQQKLARHCSELLLCTDDGSAGFRGRVDEGLASVLARHPDLDAVVAVGPPVMMRACAEVTRPLGIRTVVSLNPIMVDGTGMCGGCRVTVGGEMKFACVDGPDFDGHRVDFDELLRRLGRFRAEEALASRRWSEHCRLASAASTASEGAA